MVPTSLRFLAQCSFTFNYTHCIICKNLDQPRIQNYQSNGLTYLVIAVISSQNTLLWPLGVPFHSFQLFHPFLACQLESDLRRLIFLFHMQDCQFSQFTTIIQLLYTTTIGYSWQTSTMVNILVTSSSSIDSRFVTRVKDMHMLSFPSPIPLL